MDNFSIIYKMLTALECAMDYPMFDISEFSEKSLGVSTERMKRYLEMLQDAGYIKGADLKTDILGGLVLSNHKKIRITLKGLEYLQENTLMKKAYNTLKGITDLIP